MAVIEIKHESALRLARDLPNNALVIEGDGCDSGILIDAGIEKCDIFVATTGRDDTNLVSCELATTLFDVNRCIARVNNPRNERIFRRMGIESVSSTLVISRLIEEEALAGSMNAMESLYEDDEQEGQSRGCHARDAPLPGRQCHPPQQGVGCR